MGGDLDLVKCLMVKFEVGGRVLAALQNNGHG
jgi:hypothetical protein